MVTTTLQSSDPAVREAQAMLREFQNREFRKRCKAKYLELSDYEFAEELFDDLFDA